MCAPQMYGFEGEVKAKYDVSVMELFTELFNDLPLCAVINNKARARVCAFVCVCLGFERPCRQVFVFSCALLIVRVFAWSLTGLAASSCECVFMCMCVCMRVCVCVCVFPSRCL